MDKETLAAGESLLAKATAAPWAVYANPMRNDGVFVCHGPPDRNYRGQLPESIGGSQYKRGDAALIVFLRNNAAALLAAAARTDAAETERDAAQRLLAQEQFAHGRTMHQHADLQARLFALPPEHEIADTIVTCWSGNLPERLQVSDADETRLIKAIAEHLALHRERVATAERARADAAAAREQGLREAAAALLKAVGAAIEPIYAARQIDRAWGPLNDARKNMSAALADDERTQKP